MGEDGRDVVIGWCASSLMLGFGGHRVSSRHRVSG